MSGCTYALLHYCSGTCLLTKMHVHTVQYRVLSVLHSRLGRNFLVEKLGLRRRRRSSEQRGGRNKRRKYEREKKKLQMHAARQ